jgi:hypothetical protein
MPAGLEPTGIIRNTSLGRDDAWRGQIPGTGCLISGHYYQP